MFACLLFLSRGNWANMDPLSLHGLYTLNTFMPNLHTKKKSRHLEDNYLVYKYQKLNWSQIALFTKWRHIHQKVKGSLLPDTDVRWTRGGGGGYSPQILVGMCRGKVKNWQGLRNELPVERENGGLRNELEPFWACKWGAPERAWSILAWKWDSPELPGRVWLTRGAENGTLRNCQDASG